MQRPTPSRSRASATRDTPSPITEPESSAGPEATSKAPVVGDDDGAAPIPETADPPLAPSSVEQEALRAESNGRTAKRPARKEREGLRSRSVGGPLLGQALERARKISDQESRSEPGWLRIEPSDSAGPTQRVEALEKFREETEVALRDPVIADLHQRIAQAASDIDALKSDQATLRETLEAATRTMGSRDAEFADARRTAAAEAGEMAELREGLTESHARGSQLEERPDPPEGVLAPGARESLSDAGGKGESLAGILAPDEELVQLRELLTRRDTEIETLQRALAASNERNTELRDGTRDGSLPVDAATEDTQEPAASAPAEPKVAAAPAARVAASGQRGSWKIFSWNRANHTEPEQAVTADTAVGEAPVAVAAEIVPSLEAPADTGTAVADAPHAPPIHQYWKRAQIRSKLDRPGIASADDFFLSYLIDVCRGNPGRTNRVVSIGTGSHDLEVVLARRALDAGVRNFNIHCLSDTSSTLSSDRAFAAEPTVLRHLTLVQCRLETWPIDDPYALVLLNQSLHTFADPAGWTEKIDRALEPGGRLLFNGPIGRQDRVVSAVACEIVDQIWQRMPDRYKHSRQLEVLEQRYAERSEAHPTESEAWIRASTLLPILAQTFEFEVFTAFGNVVNAFIDPEIGPNFDPENDRERRFIDQVATLDDSKIDSGLIPPTHLLAALCREPALQVAYTHWTPEFCLDPLAGAADPGDAPSETPGAGVPGLPDPLPDARGELQASAAE